MLSANAAMVHLHWDIGHVIVERQKIEGWGAKIVDRLARELRQSFPAMRGFSTRNLHCMRSFAEEYPDPVIVQQLVASLPWGHILRITQRVKPRQGDEQLRVLASGPAGT